MAGDTQLGINGGAARRRPRAARRDDRPNTVLYGPHDKPPSGYEIFMNRAMPALVCIAIVILGYGSQWLFSYSAFFIGPGALTPGQAVVFNGSLLCLWHCFFKACTTHPGKIVYKPPTSPPPSRPQSSSSAASFGSASTASAASAVSSSSSSSAGSWAPSWVDNPSDKAILRHLRQRYPGTLWCDKCSAPKPARAHHCRVCRHCVPKMDHHCPWIGNCVSMVTFPHFLRFLVWAEASLLLLAAHYVTRLWLLYDARHARITMRSEHGVVLLLCAFVFLWFTMIFFVTAILLDTVWDWVQNQTTIESNQMSRYTSSQRRGREEGGAWWDEHKHSGYESDSENIPGNPSRRRKRSSVGEVVFPYEISFFTNMSQAMGTRNFLLWFWPLAEGPELDGDGSHTGIGWKWEENGFNSSEGLWPPREAQPYGRGYGGPSRRHGHGHGNQSNTYSGYGDKKYSWPGSRENRAREEESRGLSADSTSAEQHKSAFRARQDVDINARQKRVVSRRERNKLERREILEELDDDDEDIPLGELVRRRRQ